MSDPGQTIGLQDLRGHNRCSCPSAHPAMDGYVLATRTSTEDYWTFAAALSRQAAMTVDHALGLDDQVASHMATHRLAGPCIGSRCPNHSDDGCAVGPLAVERGAVHHHDVPDCPIRSTCRWFAEVGTGACRGCASFEHWLIVEA